MHCLFEYVCKIVLIISNEEAVFPRIFQTPDKCICNFPALRCFQSPFPKVPLEAD